MIRSFAHKLFFGRNHHGFPKVLRNFTTTGHRKNMGNDMFENDNLTSQEDENEFDPAMFRNEAHLIGKVVLNPKPIYLKDETLVGYTFLLNVSQPQYRPIYCNVTSFEPAVYENIANDVTKDSIVDVKGFFRKSVKVRMENDEQAVRRYFSIGPKLVEVLKKPDEVY